MTATRLKIGSGWIFLYDSEKEIINRLLKAKELSSQKSMYIDQFVEMTGASQTTVAKLLYLLVAVGVFRLHQISRARLFTFRPGWKEKLRERLVYYD